MEFLLFIALLFCHTARAEAVISAALSVHKNKTIILDPGHGGHDCGVKGTGGMLEKDITLSLCRYLVKELTDTYGHTVILTRSNDINPDIFQRTATANHHHGDLFISIHASGSFYHQANGIDISPFLILPQQKLIYFPIKLTQQKVNSNFNKFNLKFKTSPLY